MAKAQDSNSHQLCGACPIHCKIKPGKKGACGRFINRGNKILRDAPLVSFEEVKTLVGEPYNGVLKGPIITGIGAGTTYPDHRPAPIIAKAEIDGVEVVSSVTECMFSESEVKLKIDTDEYIGEKGAQVFYKGRAVGMVLTELYGAHLVSIGGMKHVTGKNGLYAVKAMYKALSGEALELEVVQEERKCKIEVRLGRRPTINGKSPPVFRCGCGSALVGLFASQFRELAGEVDEVAALDPELSGLFSEHSSGRDLGMPYSGLTLKLRKSTPGRYFGEGRPGWGGTDAADPLELIEIADPARVKPGMGLLIVETNGQRSAFYRYSGDRFVKSLMSPEVKEIVALVAQTCQPTRVSALFTGGLGGSARAGICRSPFKLTEAVRQSKAIVTMGGAPTYLYPGGGINVMVDAEKVPGGAFGWVPTPAIVAPVEFTMTLETYRAIGGHINSIRPVEEVLPNPEPGSNYQTIDFSLSEHLR